MKMKKHQKPKTKANKSQEIKCPHCNTQLDSKPKRNIKCQNCNKYIIVRSIPWKNNQKEIFTEKETKIIDIKKKEYFFKKRWLKKLCFYGITQEHFDHEQKRLTEKFKQKASNRDTIWRLLNKLITTTQDLNLIEQIYSEMALFLNEKNKDSFKIKQEIAKLDLLRFKDLKYVNKVKIMTLKNSCSSCKKLYGKIYTIKEALEKMPIPCVNCTHKLNKNNKYGFCRCMYLSVIDKKYEY